MNSSPAQPTVSLIKLRSDPHYNPVVPRKLHRKSNPREIAFGYGPRIFSEAFAPFRSHFITIDGTRWTVAR